MTGPVLVVGAGLIGTSVGLGLRAAGTAVFLTDIDTGRAEQAAQRGAGTAGLPEDDPALILLAVPPGDVAGEARRWQQRYPHAILTDVSSVQAPVRAAAREAGVDMARFVGSHPMAGAATGGPAGASADLFTGKPWILVEDDEVAPQSYASVEQLVAVLGGVPAGLPADDHDAAVALLSHLPHVLAFALAAQLLEAPPVVPTLAGASVRDLTRIAGSPESLWRDILTLNAGPLADCLDRVRAELDDAAAALRRLTQGPDPDAAAALTALIERGNAGRELLG